MSLDHERIANRPDGEKIPRLIYLSRILQLCIFPVATVVAGDVVLLFVPQAREALGAFGDGPRFISQVVALWAAYVLWMLSAWYVARLLLGRRFCPDLVGLCRSPSFARKLAHWLPRILAVLAALPVPLNLLLDPELRGTGAALIVTGCIVLLGLVFRRRWARWRGHEWTKRWEARPLENFERFDQLSGGAWLFIATLFVISFGLLFALPWGMEAVARPIGSPALLLYALMSWTIFGGFVLTYLPKSLGYPAVTWVLLVALVLFAPLNENHYVAGQAGAKYQPPEKISRVFADWLARRPDPRAPVIFIAASGGASRAAYWTTSALGLLEDQSRSHAYPLSANTFLISGVSGGSVGAAAFVAAVDLTHHAGAGSSPRCLSVRRLADAFAGRDDLATVTGLLLFPDMLQRFLPFPVMAWDRSRGLEEVWGRDWADVAAPCTVAGKPPNPWTRPLMDLYSASPGSPELPVLALNSTAMNRGVPVLQSNFQLSRADVIQIFSPHLATQGLTLAQAVHNSARFPYVSPAGVVQMAPESSSAGESPGGLMYWDRLGDGGYVEASGAFMVAEGIRELSQAGLIRDADSPGACHSGDSDPKHDCFVTWKQVHVVLVDNSPTGGAAYLCEPDKGGPHGSRQERTQGSIVPGSMVWPPVADATFPILGAFRTQAGRGKGAELDLLALIGGCSEQFAELRMPVPGDGRVQPSMNWMLSGGSRRFIYQVLGAPDVSQGVAYIQLAQNLARVRSWFGPAVPPASAPVPAAPPVKRAALPDSAAAP